MSTDTSSPVTLADVQREIKDRLYVRELGRFKAAAVGGGLCISILILEWLRTGGTTFWSLGVALGLTYILAAKAYRLGLIKEGSLGARFFNTFSFLRPTWEEEELERLKASGKSPEAFASTRIREDLEAGRQRAHQFLEDLEKEAIQRSEAAANILRSKEDHTEQKAEVVETKILKDIEPARPKKKPTLSSKAQKEKSVQASLETDDKGAIIS